MNLMGVGQNTPFQNAWLANAGDLGIAELVLSTVATSALATVPVEG